MVPRLRSIRSKIHLAIALTSAAIVFLPVALLVITQYASARRDLVDQLRVLAKMATTNTAAPLAFELPEDAQVAFRALEPVPSLRCVAVKRANSTVFVSRSFRGHPATLFPDTLPSDSDHIWLDDELLLGSSIEVDGHRLGTIWLSCGLESFHNRIHEIILWSFYLYLLAIALAALVAWFLQRIITRPILELGHVADRTTQEGPSSARAHKRADDEIGILVDSFNQMLDRIAEQNERLHDRERCYRTLFSQAAIAILLEDAKHCVVEANHAAATLFNQSEANLVGKATTSLFQLSEPLPSPAPGERVKVAKAEACLSDGTSVPVDLAVTGIEDGGKRFFLTSAADITDRIRAQELLVRSRDELQLQVAAATAELRETNTNLQREMDDRRRLERQMMMSEKLKGLGLMAGGIAHDFNNLLQTILGNTDLFLAEEEESLSEEGRRCAQEIKQAARAASDLASQMLAYAGKNALHIAPLSMNELIRSMLALFEAAVPKNAHLVLDLTEGLPLIDADEGQLRQVIMNLVTNSAESLPSEGGSYTIHTGIRNCDQSFLRQTLLHENLPSGRYLFIAVQDTGCGIDPAMIERIFDPFFSTKFAGRGLGLAGVLGIVRAHRAAITVQSKVGEGSTFTVFFPVSSAGPAVVEEPPAVVADWRGEGLVVVADDEEGVRHVAKRMLRLLGFQAQVVEDGEQAVEIARHQHQEVRLYILDVSMPGMGGVEAARQILAIDPTARILLSSAYGRERVQGALATLPSVGFLRKPYERETFRAQLARILG